MTPDNFNAWLTRMGYSNYRAAKELGVSKSTIANWLAGSAKISRVVALACVALEAGLDIAMA